MAYPAQGRLPHRRTGPARRIDRQRILDLRAAGLVYRDIAKIVGCTYGMCWQVVNDYKQPTHAKETGRSLRDAAISQQASDDRSTA
jgi:hypothetical protein